MQQQLVVGPARQAPSLHNCSDKLSSSGMCDGKESERGEQGAEAFTTSSKSSIADRSLVRLMERTGYSIVQQNGQRRYGPPPDWDDRQPPRGCEVFVGKIPRDCFEDELVPVFERFGRIYEMRLMMDYNGMNRGYAFVVYTQPSDAKECVRSLNNWEIRKGRTLGICMSVDNCRLFVGGIPKKVNKDDIRCEMEKVTDGVVDIIVYPSASDKSKNRGFAFIEYESHRAAAMARRKLMQGRVQLWGHQIAVDWAEPELEVAEEVMAQVKVLYVRNLMLSSTEAGIEEVFSKFAPVERVKKIRDYAFVHFHTREGALTAMENLNGSSLDGAEIEVTLAKPVDKDTYPRSPRHGRQCGFPIGLIGPVEYVPTIYPGYYQTSPKYIPRNSMGARVVRSPRNAKGKCRNLYPTVTFGPQLVFPASPVQGPYVPQYFESPKRPQLSEDPFSDLIPGVEISPAAAHQAAASAPTITATSPLIRHKTVVHLLEEVCVKNMWGRPQFLINATSQMPDASYYQCKVYIPVLGSTFLSTRFSRSIEEARCMAAEVALGQIRSIEAMVNLTSAQALHTPTTPLTPEAALSAYNPPNFVALASAAKHNFSPAATGWPEAHGIYTGFDTFAHPQQYQPATEIFQRGF